jgi:hypothetical protein
MSSFRRIRDRLASTVFGLMNIVITPTAVAFEPIDQRLSLVDAIQRKQPLNASGRIRRYGAPAGTPAFAGSGPEPAGGGGGGGGVLPRRRLAAAAPVISPPATMIAVHHTTFRMTPR